MEMKSFLCGSDKSQCLQDLIMYAFDGQCEAITLDITMDGSIQLDYKSTMVFSALVEQSNSILDEAVFRYEKGRLRAKTTIFMQLMDCLLCCMKAPMYPELEKVVAVHHSVSVSNLCTTSFLVRGFEKLSILFNVKDNAIKLYHLSNPRGLHKQDSDDCVVVRKISRGVGYGVFATKLLVSRSVTCRYYGSKINSMTADRRRGKGGPSTCYMVDFNSTIFDGYYHLEKDEFINNPKLYQNFGGRINCGCGGNGLKGCANVEINNVISGSRGKQYLEVTALRDIEPDEQLLAVYSLNDTYVHQCGDCAIEEVTSFHDIHIPFTPM